MKTYWRNKYRFADVFNYMFFNGEGIIDPEKLSDHDTNESNVVWGKDNKLASLVRERDLIKEYTDGMQLMLIGIEDQMKVHYGMPVRTMLYDALEYLKQCKELEQEHRNDKSLSTSDEFLSGLKVSDRIKPTLTLIIYYGEQAWDGPKSLSDMLDVPEKFRQFVNDYHVYVLDVNHTNNQLFQNQDNQDLFAMLHDFTSDQIRQEDFIIKYGNKHVYRETLAAFAAITGKEKLIDSLIKKEGGEGQMYSTWERWENEMREEARINAIEVLIQDNLEEGISKERILEKLQKRFPLDEEQAKAYFDKYACVES